MDNTNFETFTNSLKEWKVNSDNQYIIDFNGVNPIPTPSIPKIDFDYVKKIKCIYERIKEFSAVGFYPFKDLSIDKFVDNMMPSMCSKDCPVLKLCEEDNEKNTQQACEVCKNTFKEFLLELEE